MDAELSALFADEQWVSGSRTPTVHGTHKPDDRPASAVPDQCKSRQAARTNSDGVVAGRKEIVSPTYLIGQRELPCECRTAALRLRNRDQAEAQQQGDYQGTASWNSCIRLLSVCIIRNGTRQV